MHCGFLALLYKHEPELTVPSSLVASPRAAFQNISSPADRLVVGGVVQLCIQVKEFQVNKRKKPLFQGFVEKEKKIP